MKENLKISIIQADLHWEDAQKNLDMFSELIAKIPETTNLIILPEMFSTGFSMNAENLAEPTSGNALSWMQKIAREKNCAVTGSLIITENDKYYNRLYFVFPTGKFEQYDKRHTFTLAKEHETYDSGTKKLIVDYEGWKICPLVCYDLRFPVWARNVENYDLLIYVANWPETRIHAWDILLQARAIENMSYCIGVNRTGEDGNKYRYNGHSAVYDSLGKNLLNSITEKVFVSTVEISKEHLQENRNKLKFLQDRDSFSLK